MRDDGRLRRVVGHEGAFIRGDRLTAWPHRRDSERV